MSSTHAKPSVAQVREFLAQSQALIVHFSGSPPGLGKPRNFRFPDDLKHVLAGQAMGGVSCSLVMPGDIFHGDVRHSLGTVGVIVDLRIPESLHAVSPGDAGSYEDAEGVRHVYDQDITVEDLTRSLADRGTHYNEWVVRDYVVRGLFVATPMDVWGTIEFDIPPEAAHLYSAEPTLGPVDIDVQQVLANFQDRDVFAFQDNRIVNVRTGSPVSHAELYPTSAN